MKKRKGVTIKINFTNRWLYSLIAIGILVIISAGVYAWANSAGVGHSYNELQPCSGTQILKMNGAGAWACGSDIDTGITTETDPQVGAVTSSRWCIGDGSAVQCNQIPLSKGVEIWKLNDGCKGPSQMINSDDVVFSKTCLSASCGSEGLYQSCGNPSCYHCTSCSGAQRTCDNERMGYLVY